MRPYHCLPIDANTKAYYRFGERLDLLDLSGNGYTLTAYNGAALSEHGVVLDATAAKYAQTAAAINLFGATAVTLEAWERWAGSDPAAGVYRQVATWQSSTPTQYIYIFLQGQAGGIPALWTQARIGTTPTNSARSVQLTSEQWAAMKAGEFHIETIVDISAGKHELYLNGVQIISANVAFPAIASANGYVLLGWTSSAGTWIGTIDEVRLSTVARHTAAFVPRRFTDGQRAGIRGPGLELATAGAIV